MLAASRRRRTFHGQQRKQRAEEKLEKGAASLALELLSKWDAVEILLLEMGCRKSSRSTQWWSCCSCRVAGFYRASMGKLLGV